MRITLFVACVLFSITSSAFGQSAAAVFNATGIQPDHVGFSGLPFEHIDTATGSLVLTFQDIVLPGNGGSALVAVRSYNSKTELWTFGFPGIVLFISDKWGTSQVTEDPMWSTYDGGVEVAATKLFLASGLDGLEVVTNGRFWVLHRPTRMLYGPDGSLSKFNPDGRLEFHDDAFGNRVTAAWTSAGYTLTQKLSDDESRVITVEYETLDGCSGGCLPKKVTVDGRSWEYVKVPGTPRRLQEARPPEGPSWHYGYPGAGIEVTTPSGGRVEYAFETKSFSFENVPETYQFKFVRTRRMIDPRTGAQSEWTFDHDWLGWDQISHTRVFSPAGPEQTVTTFEYGFAGEQGVPRSWLYPGRSFVLRSRKVTRGAETIEEEQLEYEWLPLPGVGDAAPAIKTVTVYRPADGVTFHTSYGYVPGNSYADFHNARTIVESTTTSAGTSSRTLTRTFGHYPATAGAHRMIVGRLTSEKIDVSGAPDPFTRSWTYLPGNGFTAKETVSGRDTTYTPTSQGNVLRVETPTHDVTTFEYAWGQVSKIQSAAHTTTRQVRPDGRVESETVGVGSANVRTTHYQYDGLSRPTVVAPPGAGRPATLTEYDNSGGAWVRVMRGTSQVTTTLDGFGRPIATENSLGVKTVTAYDARGRVAFQSQPFTGSSGHGVQFTYDGLGRVARETNTADGSDRTYDYSGGDVTITDENDRSTVMSYETFGSPEGGRLTQVVDPAGAVWQYAYDSADNLRQVSGPNGVTRTWHYTNNLLDQETHPESGTTTFTYQDGRLRTKTDANGVTLTMGYDANGRLASVSGGDRPATIEYEPGSDLRAKTTVAGVVSAFQYDGGGRLARRDDTIDGKTFTSSYAYDAQDNLSLLTYPSGRRVGYTYDPENRIVLVTAPDRGATGEVYASGFGYHPSGALTEYFAGNGVKTTMAYDSRGRLGSLLTAAANDTLQLTYGYDPVGNVTSIIDARGANSQAFGYDAVDRLRTVAGMGATSYTYDAHGNRQSAGGLTYTYESGNRFRLQSIAGGAPLSYDHNGNLTTAPGVTYAYTADNLMRRAESGATVAEYAYDLDAWRVKKDAGGTTTYYLRGPNGQLLTEWTNGPETADIREYVYAGSRVLASVKLTAPPK